jgi:hypothetical protein
MTLEHCRPEILSDRPKAEDFWKMIVERKPGEDREGIHGHLERVFHPSSLPRPAIADAVRPGSPQCQPRLLKQEEERIG